MQKNKHYLAAFLSERKAIRRTITLVIKAQIRTAFIAIGTVTIQAHRISPTKIQKILTS